MKLVLTQAAEGDLEEIYDYYQSQRAGLGDEFVVEFRRAVDRILSYPHAWQPLDDNHLYRRCRLHRFTYGVVYVVNSPTQDFWSSRSNISTVSPSDGDGVFLDLDDAEPTRCNSRYFSLLPRPLSGPIPA